MTYTISGDGDLLDYSQLRKLFKENSKNGIIWVEKPASEEVYVSFGTFGDFLICGKIKRWDYDPLFVKQKTAIKNVLGYHNAFINKSKLYNTIKKLIPNGIKYLPKSYTVDQFENTFLKDTLPQSKTLQGLEVSIAWPLIVKKDFAVKQKGVIVINSKDEYFEAKKQLYKLELERAKIKKIKPNYSMIISEYISNPLLIEGRKFHLRAYFLLSVISGIVRCTIFPMSTYKIRTAKLQYVHGDWSNADIHLTGGSFTDKRYNYVDILKK